MKNFDLNAALNGNQVVTRNGNKVKVLCTSRDKVVANVYPAHGMGLPTQKKFNLDGTRYGINYPHHEDLFIVG